MTTGGMARGGANSPDLFVTCQSEFMFTNQSNHGGPNRRPYLWDKKVDPLDKGTFCHRGYDGPLCSVCLKGFSKTADGCKQCASTEGAVAWAGIFGAVVFYKIAKRMISKAMATPMGTYIRVASSVAPTLLGDIRVFISVYQTVGAMGVTLSLSWPEEVAYWINYMKGLVSFDLFTLPAVGCFVTGNFYVKLATMLALPTVIELLIYFVHEHQFKKLHLDHIPDVERDEIAQMHLNRIHEMERKAKEAEVKDTISVFGLFRYAKKGHAEQLAKELKENHEHAFSDEHEGDYEHMLGLLLQIFQEADIEAQQAEEMVLEHAKKTVVLTADGEEEDARVTAAR
eukprot:COSAG06_NODE_2662_length_6476_cov_3.911400_2_plen_340_part_01